LHNVAIINNAVSGVRGFVFICPQDDVREVLTLQYYLHYVSISGE